MARSRSNPSNLWWADFSPATKQLAKAVDKTPVRDYEEAKPLLTFKKGLVKPRTRLTLQAGVWEGSGFYHDFHKREVPKKRIPASVRRGRNIHGGPIDPKQEEFGGNLTLWTRGKTTREPMWMPVRRIYLGPYGLNELAERLLLEIDKLLSDGY